MLLHGFYIIQIISIVFELTANSSDGVSSVVSVALASEQSASVRQAFLLLPQVARVRHCRVASAWWHALTGLRVALETIPEITFFARILF